MPQTQYRWKEVFQLKNHLQRCEVGMSPKISSASNLSALEIIIYVCNSINCDHWEKRHWPSWLSLEPTALGPASWTSSTLSLKWSSSLSVQISKPSFARDLDINKKYHTVGGVSLWLARQPQKKKCTRAATLAREKERLGNRASNAYKSFRTMLLTGSWSHLVKGVLCTVHNTPFLVSHYAGLDLRSRTGGFFFFAFLIWEHPEQFLDHLTLRVSFPCICSPPVCIIRSCSHITFLVYNHMNSRASVLLD